jgi:hypothetical protein
MTSLKEVLEQHPVDRVTVELAARFYVAEVTDDLDVGEMRHVLVDAAGDEEAVDRALAGLAHDPLLLENAALVTLSDGFADEARRQRVLEILEDARGQMPVIDLAILAVVLMYGMYLLTTGGKKAETTTVRRPDGTLEESRIDYASPDGPMSILTRLFQR